MRSGGVHGDVVGMPGEAGDLVSAQDVRAQVEGLVLQQCLGALLGQGEGVGERAGQAAEVQAGVEAAEVASGQRYALTHEGLVRAAGGKGLDGARVHGQGAGAGVACGAGLDHGDGDARASQFAGEPKAHGSGTCDDNLIVHDLSPDTESWSVTNAWDGVN